MVDTMELLIIIDLLIMVTTEIHTVPINTNPQLHLFMEPLIIFLVCIHLKLLLIYLIQIIVTIAIEDLMKTFLDIHQLIML